MVSLSSCRHCCALGLLRFAALLIIVAGCSEPAPTPSPSSVLPEPDVREQESAPIQVRPSPAAGTSSNQNSMPAGLPPSTSATDASQDGVPQAAKRQEDKGPPKRPEPGHPGKFLVADGRYLTPEEISAENKKKRAAQTDKSKTPQQSKFDDLPVYGAEYLTRQYMANEVAADAQFKTAEFIVSGEIVEIGKDTFGTPYVQLRGQDYSHWVRCTFPRDAAGQLAYLSRGTFVSIYAVCIGSSSGAVLLVKWRLMSDYVNLQEGQGLTWRKGKERLEANVRASIEAMDRKQNWEADQRKLKEDRKAKEKAELARIEEAKFRTWTSDKYSVEAKAVSYAIGVVTLETRAGRKTKVEVGDLSEKDQEYIRKCARS